MRAYAQTPRPLKAEETVNALCPSTLPYIAVLRRRAWQRAARAGNHVQRDEEFVRRPPPPAKLEQLTARETEVLHLLARGHSNADIAKELYITEATVRTHVLHVLQKLELRDRIHAVIYAYETGLIQPGGQGSARPGGGDG